ncbi:WXG100 family type VII secretion target [Streptomyces ziwulingensis]|uniref:WXG100 family type VII secretion target n=1 Tax=Streptomyces ziwulingensis TaxID=1045501 RepID=A0ABP9BIP3_9ACTN
MPDYNSGGFHQGEDGTIFGNPDGSSNGSVTDYDNWDWKQIKAAVYGMSSGVATDANVTHARSIADPQSLLDAANAFFHVQRTLEGVTKSLIDQAKALAGDNGPWSGAAADAFLDMMTNFSRQVKANADVLSGGSTGDHSVPHQLANNAIAFQSAQNKLAEIDSWYADQAVAMGVTPMADGLIPISRKPELVAMLTEDMRAVLKSLAHSYQVTTDAVVNPTPVTSPAGNPDGLPDADTELGLGGSDGLGDGLGEGIGDLGGTGGLGDTGSLSALSGYPDTGLDTGPDTGLDTGLGTGLDTGTGDGIGGLGDVGDVGDIGALDTSAAPSAYPGDLSLDDTGLGTSGLDSAGLGDLGLAGLDPSALDSALNPVSFPGLGGLGGLAGLSGSGLGADGKSSLGALSTADPTAFGDTGLGTGLDDGLGDSLTGGLDSGLTDALSAGSPAPSQLATSSGMPYMPGMGGTGAGGAAPTAEPTDASGLLDSSADPWEGAEVPGGDEVGSDAGAAAGGEGLGLGMGGMPYLPGMGGGAGASAAGRDGTGERTDASGLLDPSTEPWAGEEETGDDEAGSLEATPPGVPCLPGFDAGAPTARAAAGVPGVPDGRRAGAAALVAADPVAAAPVAADPAEEAPAAGEAVAPPDTGTASVAVGSDGLPLPGNDDEEDFSAWEAGTGAGAFVPLLWAVRGADGRQTDERPEPGSSAEPRGTWQPDRTGTEPSSGARAGVRGPALCGDGGPEPEPEEPEPEEPDETPDEEQSSRSSADLLVQPQSTWGTVPGNSPATL